MRKRAYVLIFSFWAFLTIITPTLIQWSAAASASAAAAAAQAQPTANITDNDSTTNSSEGLMKSRRMLAPFDGINMGSKAPPPLPLSPVASPLSPSPSVQPFKQAERLQPEFAAEHRNIRSREVKGIL